MVRIDPRTLSPGRRIRVGRGPNALAFGAGFLWVAHDDGTVRRVDLRRRRTGGAPVSVGRQASGLAFGDGRAWAVAHKSGALVGLAAPSPSSA